MLMGEKRVICRLTCFLIENIFSYTQVVSNIEINCQTTDFRSKYRLSGRHFKKLAYHYPFVFVIGRQIKAYHWTTTQSLSLDDKSKPFIRQLKACHWTRNQSLTLYEKSKLIIGRQIKAYHWTTNQSMSLDNKSLFCQRSSDR